MEKPSPADSTSPSSASGSSTAPAQPTYTTAGTIYNPSSLQPLQPPARRGRSLKWTSGGVYSDLSLLPRSLLASLQAKSNGRNSPYPAQYTPLQQNYDRAAIPMVAPELADDVSSKWGRNSISPSVEVEEMATYMVHDAEHDGDDEEEEEDEGINNIMMNMTVKSLHNLASYPNPNQKMAQKALLRPVKPRLNQAAQNGSGSNGLSAQPFVWEQRTSPDLPVDRSWATKARLSNSDSVTSHVMARAELQSITGNVRNLPSPSQNSDNTEQSAAWLAHALGGPRPLTAGPPGQRQYRASTFKSTFKALSTETANTKQTEEDDAYSATARVLQHVGIDDAHNTLEGQLSIYETETAHYIQGFQGSQTIETESNNGYGSVTSPHKRAYSANSHINGITNDGQAATRPWAIPESAAERYRNPGYEASLTAYNEKMNKLWYFGCETLCGEDVMTNKAESVVGVIGDGRPGQGNRHRELKIQEANKMDVAEHAKPLLDMAMANLERRLDELVKVQQRGRV